MRSKCKNRDSVEGKGGWCGVWQMQRETWIYEGWRGGIVLMGRDFCAEGVAKIVTALPVAMRRNPINHRPSLSNKGYSLNYKKTARLFIAEAI